MPRRYRYRVVRIEEVVWGRPAVAFHFRASASNAVEALHSGQRDHDSYPWEYGPPYARTGQRWALMADGGGMDWNPLIEAARET